MAAAETMRAIVATTSAAGRTIGAIVVPRPIADSTAATQNGHFGISTAPTSAPIEPTAPRRDIVLMTISYGESPPVVE